MNDLSASQEPERRIATLHQPRPQSENDAAPQPKSLLKAPVEWRLISQRDIQGHCRNRVCEPGSQPVSIANRPKARAAGKRLSAGLSLIENG